MKWYSVELPNKTRENLKRNANFQAWLYDNNFEHKINCYKDVLHFEIFANPKDISKINKALDKIVYFDAIY